MNANRVIAVLLVGAALFIYASRSGRLHPLSGGGTPAPPFKLSLLDGGDFEHKGGDGPVTLIDFWATWCAPCRQELPHIDAIHRRFADRGLRVVAVDAEPIEAREFAERIRRDLGLELPIALAGDDVAARYHVENLPTVVLVDRAGRVARVLLGVHGESELASLVESALR